MSISSVIKSIQDIMRQDAGVDGDAQRLSNCHGYCFSRYLMHKKKHLSSNKKTIKLPSLSNTFGVIGQLTLKASLVRSY